jgi:GxxExxY protein
MPLVYEDLSYRIRGALYEVYNTLGPGFREETYKLALINELQRQGIPVAREVDFEVGYKGITIDLYRADIVVDAKVIIELKAVEQLLPRHTAQLLSYLKASGLQLGPLVNFGKDRLQIVRQVNSTKGPPSAESA